MLCLPIVTQGSGCDLLDEVWRDHADEVRCHGIDSGPFIPEEDSHNGFAQRMETRPTEACNGIQGR